MNRYPGCREPMKTEQRHLFKTLTWRLLGTSDTILISWVLTGNPLSGLKIGLAEVLSKLLLYYLHERAWVKHLPDNPGKKRLIKTLTWRLLGTVDTVIIGWIITGSPITGLKIGVAEIVTKMLLYYLHEWCWDKFPMVISGEEATCVDTKINS